MLNYPCCAFPVTTVDPAQDILQPRDTFLGELDKQEYVRFLMMLYHVYK